MIKSDVLVKQISLYFLLFFGVYISTMTIVTSLNPNSASIFDRLGFTSAIIVKTEPNGLAHISLNNYDLTQTSTTSQGRAAGVSQFMSDKNLGLSAEAKTLVLPTNLKK